MMGSKTYIMFFLYAFNALGVLKAQFKIVVLTSVAQLVGHRSA